jgi:hypothetical protein
MMGQRKREQGELFYSFRLDDAVPEDHAVRELAAVLDLSWVYAELASYYPRIGRPSIGPLGRIKWWSTLEVGGSCPCSAERLWRGRSRHARSSRQCR